jgi:hypothetical protein
MVIEPEISNEFLGYQAGKVLERTVISLFGTIRKTAGRQLTAFQMVPDAFAANSFSLARS